MTTDEYFKSHNEKFDLAFVDANHHHDQVFKDSIRCIERLNDGGMLMMHDCSPPTVHYENPSLCETAWRAFVKLRESQDLDAIVADWDCGIGMVRKRKNPEPIKCGKTMDEMRWIDFEMHRQDWMHMSTASMVADWLVGK
jgi:hypothetical protein